MKIDLRPLRFVLIVLGLAGRVSLLTAEGTVNVQILCINDFHGSILQTSEVKGRPAGGAAVLAAWLKDRERSNPNTWVVHAGDMAGASQPISGLLQDEPTGHFRGAAYPLVLANVVDSGTKVPIFPPYAVKVVEGIPVVFIGVITRETPSLVAPECIRGLDFLDPAGSVNKYVSELRIKGIEAFVVLAHEGGMSDGKTGRIKGPVAEMAKKVDDAVDVILCGHSHTKLNSLVDGKLVVQAYSKGIAFADVDMVLSKETGDVVSKRAEIVTAWAGEKKADPQTLRMIRPAEKKVMPFLERKICRSASAISKQQNRVGESELGDLIADAQRWAVKTQVAFMNPGGIRRSLPAGTITWGILYETQPFGNTLMRFRMTGDQIKRLLNQQWPGNRFLQISGIRYVWSEQKPIGRKVIRVTLANGTPIGRNKQYTVTANHVLAAGGDSFSVFREVAHQEKIKIDLDALIEYLKTRKQPVFVKVDGRITKVK